ncbi:MAG: hypothetical protein IT269_09460 [Saprospiraceae bacterium]|nr:hypothetical protein [Saprospiraceae bacterium]
MSEKFVQVAAFNFPTDPEVALFENILYDNDIQFQVRDSGIIGQDPLLQSAIGGVKFFVVESRAEEARELYLEFAHIHGINTGETESGKGMIQALIFIIALIIIGFLIVALG